MFGFSVHLVFCKSILGVLFALITGCNGSDYFSSVPGLENLFQTEAIVLNELKDYVAALKEHVSELESEIETIQLEHLEASKDLEGYLNNPVNVYRLVERLHSDWSNYEEAVRSELSAKNFLDNMATHRQLEPFPSASDMEDVVLALVRLQETYKLDVSQVASGILNGVNYGSAMSWQDCFMLGQHLFVLRDFNHTIPWLKQSMTMLTSQQYHDNPIALDFMETVASYHQEMGDFETALTLINKVLDLDSSRNDSRDSKKYLEHMLSIGAKKIQVHETPSIELEYKEYRQSNEFHLYEKVCRGEITASPTKLRQLCCKYHTNNVEYRLIQPYKMEEHNLDPYIVQFHDVISDEEIQVIKRLAKPRLERSKVRSSDGTADITAQTRTSGHTWIRYTKHQVMRGMLLHLQHFSGLNVTFAEQLQVANYGIGGHYEPHWDFFTEDVTCKPEEGNRISTAIFYLSDVEEGGGTAFPFLSLLIKPKKGSVLFWYNLHTSNEPDYRTKHAACPVLKGSKWIANIWLHVRSQEFNRPCSLKPEGATSIAYKDFRNFKF